MILWLTNLLIKFCEWRGRVLQITGTSGPEDVYLIRYYLVQSKYFNIFIHRFLRSDRDDLHDHPWDFATYVVQGSYVEYKHNPETLEIDQTYRSNQWKESALCYGRSRIAGYPDYNNTLVFRKATDRHQVVLHRDFLLSEKEQAPLTICVTGRIKREWGFWVKDTFVPWKDYLNLPKDAASRG